MDRGLKSNLPHIDRSCYSILTALRGHRSVLKWDPLREPGSRADGLGRVVRASGTVKAGEMFKCVSRTPVAHQNPHRSDAWPAFAGVDTGSSSRDARGEISGRNGGAERAMGSARPPERS